MHLTNTNDMKTLNKNLESLISTFDNNKNLKFWDIKFVEEFSKENQNCLATEVELLILIFDNKQKLNFNLLHKIVKEFDKKHQ